MDNEKKIYELPNKKSELLKNSIKQRVEPFNNLQIEHLSDLAIFIGGEIEIENNFWILSKNYFLDIEIVLIYDIKTKNLDIEFKGDHIVKINNYSRDLLAIFLMNHCLRFISIKYPKLGMPKIVKQCFSFSYIKSHF